ncbi:hypothetical protein [Ruegeria sp.]|uniref:hypothetical protein n=1 Tax=Ruegeria sp. TaxID=1879320 RepID=UPI0023249A04|nr:hypothetical protein [Ruegeria sp.]MDA7965055.1 hypothetical protein [Ruegeria sp.]
MSDSDLVIEKPDASRWRVFILAVFVCAAILRIVQIQNAEIWLDEAMTWHYASQPWAEIADFVSSNDVHPPLHYWFTKLFLVFGDGAFALRIGPVLLELLALPLIYWSAFNLAPEGRKRAVGLVAIVLAAASANMVSTGLLARSYAGLYLCFTICFAALSWIVAHREMAVKSVFTSAGGPAALRYGALALGLAGMAWFHNLGLLYGAAVGVIAFLIWIFVLGRRLAAFVNFAAAAGLAFLLYLPQLGTFLRQLGSVSSDYWIQQPSLFGLIRSFLQIFGQNPALQKTSVVGMALAGLVCLIGFCTALALIRQRNWAVLLPTAGLLVAVYGLFVLVTFGVKPIMLNRTMYPMLAPWFVLLALGVCAISWPALRWGLATGLTAILLFAALHVTDSTRWRSEVLQQIAQDAGSAPTLITVPNAAAVMMDYHTRRLDLAINTIPLPAPYPDHSEGARFTTGWPGVPALNDRALQTLETALADNPEDVWVFLRAYWIYDPDALFKPYLDQRYCYQPVDGLPSKLNMVFKLAPRATLAGGPCDDMGNDVHFPYERPDYGRYSLAEPTP